MAISIPIISEWDGRAIDRAKKEFSQLEGAGAKASYAIKKAAIPAAAALAGLGAALFQATKGAIEDEAAQAKLAGQLRRSVQATDAQIKANEDFITSAGKAFGVTDDKLRPAISKLTVASKDLSRAQKLAKVAMDISAATGKDLETVTAALTKAELGQYASLKKLGVPIGDNTRALMDMAAETKKVHKAELELEAVRAGGGSAKEVAKATEKLREAQEKLNAVTVEGADYMDDLNKVFSGAAAEAANTTAGRFQRMKVALDETKESIGASLLPVIEKALPLLNSFSTWAQNNPGVFTKVALAIGGIAAATLAVNAAMAVNPYVLAAAGVVALAVAFERLFQQLEKINKIGGIAARIISSLSFGGALNIGKPILDFFKDFSGSISSLPKGLSGADISKFNIPAMADGGIVTNPTLALIGEAGPEAVVPLNRAGGVGTNVTINVNGGDPNAVVNALRTYMQVNGSVPIRVAS